MRLVIDSKTDETPQDEEHDVGASSESQIHDLTNELEDVDPGEFDQDDESEDYEDAARQGVDKRTWRHRLAFVVLPACALILAGGVGYLKWQDSSARASQDSAVESVRVATESAIAMLAYQPDTVDKDLAAAANRLTGNFRNDYTKLINDIVIPGSKAKRVTAVATVPSAASISATANHAQVLVFVNQTTTIGDGVPTNSISSVRITLDKVDDQWLVSGFEPV